MADLPFEYTCVALDERSGGRCRNIAETRVVAVDKIALYCPHHLEKFRLSGKLPERALEPDVVLVQFFLGRNTGAEARNIFSAAKERNWPQSEARNAKRARELGLNPYYYRRRAGNGTAVFGGKGLKAVSVSDLQAEFGSEGFVFRDAHISKHRLGKEALSCAFVYGEGKESVIGVEEKDFIDFLFDQCWAYAHIWANPPKEDETVTHAVNLLSMGGRADFSIKFVKGLWYISA